MNTLLATLKLGKPILTLSGRNQIMKVDKTMFKKSGDELQEYLQFQRRATKVPAKKGKGSFKRKSKHREDDYRRCA
jgi:isocitrate dehydrogenase